MMNNSQPQETIPLLLKDSRELTATLNGNNAAWMCVCGYTLPLLLSGMGGKNHKPVICNECGKKYRAELTYGKIGKKKPTIPTKIKEIEQ